MSDVVRIQGYPGKEIRVGRIDSQSVCIAIHDGDKVDSVLMRRETLAELLRKMLTYQYPDEGLSCFELRHDGSILRIEHGPWKGSAQLSVTHDSPPRRHSIRIFHSHLVRLREAVEGGGEE